MLLFNTEINVMKYVKSYLENGEPVVTKLIMLYRTIDKERLFNDVDWIFCQCDRETF